MTSKEFRKLIYYLRNRPSEAAELLGVLTEVATSSNQTTTNGVRLDSIGNISFENAKSSSESDQKHTEWLTAQEVGEKVGMSAQWVKDHMKLLATSMYRQVPHGRRTWLFSEGCVDAMKCIKYAI